MGACIIEFRLGELLGMLKKISQKNKKNKVKFF
jgi:hypothetical protein